MTIDFTLRLPIDLAQLIDKERGNEPRSAFIIRVLDERYNDLNPGLKLGSWELLESEIGPNAECPLCHNPFGTTGIYAVLMSGIARPEIIAPVCAGCAA